MSYKSVSVIGLGYIGLPTAALIASHMHNVIGVDVNEDVVRSVNAGVLHTVEPGLADLLAETVTKGWLRGVAAPEPAEVFIIAVPTPITEDKKPDLSYVKAAALSLIPALRKGTLVILESTSPVGTTERMSAWLAEARPDLTFPHQAERKADVQIAYCPERILPGKMLDELVHNDRVVGGLNDKASAMAVEFYKLFVQGQIITANVRTAEMCKLVENSFRDVNIAFANELSMICDKLSIDVWELIKLANRHPRVNILQPGCGVGGHCIAVDPWFIVDSAPEEAQLITIARKVNDHKPEWVEAKVKQAIMGILDASSTKKMADVTVACWGLMYKPDANDMRNSPALKIIRKIEKFGCKLAIVDPYWERGEAELYDIEKWKSSADTALKADVHCYLVPHRDFCDVNNAYVSITSVLACNMVLKAKLES
ncbi:UDP-N-acetyl-D-mannosamine dehydrogenase [Desulfovibrio desulfuricans]|uniref:UDP-N-acetyl-D-mannosamine dehydrogenase n=1 Tax=Desulfovibrio desulfuricans TaxID=876 RepID=UPI0039841BFC